MGYSYAAKAGYTLDAINKLINHHTSNGMPDGGFYEHGREQSDGAITGTVYKPYAPDPSKCIKRGSFRINPDGRVNRFPGLPTSTLRQAEQMGAATYAAYHGTWRERGAAMLPDLENNKIVSYTWFESIFREWQQENRIMFAVQPRLTNEDIADALRGMLSEESAP